MAKNTFFIYIRINCLTNFMPSKLSLVAVKSTNWNMKLSCFPKVGTTQAVSSPWVRCLTTWGAVFLNHFSVLQSCMHWVYKMYSKYSIFQQWFHFLVTHSFSLFKQNIFFTNIDMMRNMSQICWRTLVIPMKKDQAWFRDYSYRVSD